MASVDFTEARYRTAVIRVQLAQKRWTTQDIAGMTSILVTEIDSIAAALSIINYLDMQQHLIAEFLCDLYNQLPAREWEARREVMQAMQEQQRKYMCKSEWLR